MALTGQQLKALRNALVDAFNPATFEQMLRFELNKKVEKSREAGLSTPSLIKVIDAAEMEGWTLDLSARRALQIPAMPISTRSRTCLSLSSTRELPLAALNFEKVVRDGVPFLDPATFRSKLGRIEQQVCSDGTQWQSDMAADVLVGADYVSDKPACDFESRGRHQDRVPVRLCRVAGRQSDQSRQSLWTSPLKLSMRARRMRTTPI